MRIQTCSSFRNYAAHSRTTLVPATVLSPLELYEHHQGILLVPKHKGIYTGKRLYATQGGLLGRFWFTEGLRIIINFVRGAALTGFLPLENELENHIFFSRVFQTVDWRCIHTCSLSLLASSV